MRADIQEIKPGYGLGILKFGMYRDEVKEILGAPTVIDAFSYTDDDQELTESWEYEDLHLSLNFDEEDDWRLVMISVTDSFYQLQGEKIIGELYKAALVKLKSLDLGYINIEDNSSNSEPNTCLLTIDLLGMNFWIEDNVLNEIQWSPQFIDDDTIKMAIAKKRYTDYSSFIKGKFNQRVQKISLDTGFTCPNRDGSKGVGGCTYCNNNTFNPDYCAPAKSITRQLDEGIGFFSAKYKSQQYLAYFQAYTNTYADIKLVKNLYTEAINHPGVIGLVIGTRPDCLSEELIDFLSELAENHYISLEFGVESTLNKTLALVNRCHTFEETIAAYDLVKDRGLHLGAHLILGLPGETVDEMLHHATELSKLPVQTLKIHHLQIVKHTMMAIQYSQEPAMFNLFGIDEYVDFITEFIALLRPDIIIERFISESPTNLLIAPKWGGLKNFEIVAKIDKLLIEKDLWQGKYYTSNI